MDIIVTHVYDKCRFAYYIEAKFQMYKMAAITMANDINRGYAVKLCNLPECDVRYLQRVEDHCNYANPGICNLKILNNMESKLIKQIPPYCDNERKSFEQKVEDMYNGSHVYSVTYTELVKRNSTMTKQEIDKLLTNPCIKSINIEK